MLEQAAGAENPFLTDVLAVRGDSRAVLSAASTLTQPDAARAIGLLQSVLAAEIICVIRYTLLGLSEEGLRNERLATEFQAQANDERRHMRMLAARITALGGVADFSPAGLQSRITAFTARPTGHGNVSFATRLQQNLAAEQCVVEHYRELVAYFDRHDPQTAAILKDILQDEEDHTSDMQDLLTADAG